MTSIDATRKDFGGTRPNLEGPYYLPNAPLRANGVLFEGTAARRTDSHADRECIEFARPEREFRAPSSTSGTRTNTGIYDREGSFLRGVIRADENGRYMLRTVVPDDYSEHDTDPIGELFRAMGQGNHRAAHIHLKIHIDGVERLMTQLFIPHSRVLDSDYVVGAVSDDLLLRLEDAPPVAGQGPQYTATFDFVVRRQAARQAAE